MGLEEDPEAQAALHGAETGDVTVRPETAHASVSVPSPRVATHSHYPDGTEEIVIGGVGFRSSSVVGREDQRQDSQLLGNGRPAQNEQDVLQACRSLRAALPARGPGPRDLPGRLRPSPPVLLVARVVRMLLHGQLVPRRLRASLRAAPGGRRAGARRARRPDGRAAPPRAGRGPPCRQRRQVVGMMAGLAARAPPERSTPNAA
jgi:hypothetical protein